MGAMANKQQSKQSRTKDTRSRIIDAAANVFVEVGYARATTRQIAAASGLTEMTLFRHFGNKQNLFAAVLEQYAIGPDSAAMFQSGLTGDFAQDMLAIGQYVAQIMIERRDVMKMMLCEADHFPELQEVLGQVPRKLRDMISAFLQTQIEAGTIKPRDPDMMAQAFMGFFFSYTVALGFLDQAMVLDSSEDQLINEFVDLFVQGTLQT
jgi:TetR/AcrR family transcriptional repressor of mexJK operon